MALPGGYALFSGEELNQEIDEAVKKAVVMAAPLALPASDPYVANQLWNSGGSVMISAGPPYVISVTPDDSFVDGGTGTFVLVDQIIKGTAWAGGPVCTFTFWDQTVQLSDIASCAWSTLTALVILSGANGVFLATCLETEIFPVDGFISDTLTITAHHGTTQSFAAGFQINPELTVLTSYVPQPQATIPWEGLLATISTTSSNGLYGDGTGTQYYYSNIAVDGFNVGATAQLTDLPPVDGLDVIGFYGRNTFATAGDITATVYFGGSPNANLQFDIPITVAPAPVTDTIILNSGATSWQVPWDWKQAGSRVECLGAGAPGSHVAPFAGGGGGGYARIDNVALTPGAIITVQVGSASPTEPHHTWFVSQDHLCGGGTSTEAGGIGSGIAAQVTYAGGTSSGSADASFLGGVGGGAAGPSGAGGNPWLQTADDLAGTSLYPGSADGGNVPGSINQANIGSEWYSLPILALDGSLSNTVAAGCGSGSPRGGQVAQYGGGGAGANPGLGGTVGDGGDGVLVITYEPPAFQFLTDPGFAAFSGLVFPRVVRTNTDFDICGYKAHDPTYNPTGLVIASDIAGILIDTQINEAHSGGHAHSAVGTVELLPRTPIPIGSYSVTLSITLPDSTVVSKTIPLTVTA